MNHKITKRLPRCKKTLVVLSLLFLFSLTIHGQISTFGNHPDRHLIQYYDGPNPNDSAIFIGYDKDDLSLDGSGLTTNEVDLAVGDMIMARGAKFTETGGWRDFVFDADYQLLSLDEVQAFITTHGHLPDVPSESQIVKQGHYDQHEINMALLQKIEELTLYTIQQQKEIDRLSLALKDK